MPAFYTPARVREIALTNRKFAATANAREALNESVETRFPSDYQTFDIFLSYRNADIELAVGVHTDLRKRGYKVYLDRIMDPHLDRSNVTAATAEQIRKRLMQSKSVFYIATDNAEGSNWMPWELGFEDGYRGKSAIVPVTNNQSFKGTEFVAVYPRVQPDPGSLWIYYPDNTLDTTFETWRDRVPERNCGMPKCPLR
jgi:TIR domain